MHNETFFDKIFNDKNVFYIYSLPKELYGITDNSSDNFIFIVSDDHNRFNKDRYEADGAIYYKFIISEWFKKIENNDLLAWQCCSLKPRYVIKEHVKLLIKLDLAKLRKSVLNEYNKAMSLKNWYDATNAIKFGNQIIISYKITNFKESLEMYHKLHLEDFSEEDFLAAIHKDLEFFREKTNGFSSKVKVSSE